jgi:hypothetical protein
MDMVMVNGEREGPVSIYVMCLAQACELEFAKTT